MQMLLRDLAEGMGTSVVLSYHSKAQSFFLFPFQEFSIPTHLSSGLPPRMPRNRTRWTRVCKTALPSPPRMSNYSAHLHEMQFCWSELDETSELSTLQKLIQTKTEKAWQSSESSESSESRHQLSEGSPARRLVTGSLSGAEASLCFV